MEGIVPILLDVVKLPERPTELRRLSFPLEQDVASQAVVGKKLILKLEEHAYRKRSAVTIEGHTGVIDSKEIWYLLRPEPAMVQALGKEVLLFHPEATEFTRDFQKEKKRDWRRGIGYVYEASLEDLVINPSTIQRKIFGRVAASKKPEAVRDGTLRHEHLEILARGVVRPFRGRGHREDRQ